MSAMIPVPGRMEPMRLWATLATGAHTAHRVMPILQAAVDSARLGPITMADVSTRAGVAGTTIYRYFNDMQSLEALAHLILLEDSLARYGGWAHPDNTSDWDDDLVGSALENWAGALAASTDDGISGIRSIAVVRGVASLAPHLTAMIERSVVATSGRLRDWQARSLVTDEIDTYVQAVFMHSLDHTGWFRRSLRSTHDGRTADPRWHALLSTIAHDLRRLEPRTPLADNTWTNSVQRPPRLPDVPVELSSEIDRILALEVTDPTPTHRRVIDEALGLLIDHPASDFTIGDLTQASGVPPKRLYELFPSKDIIRRVALWSFTSATISAHLGLLRHIGNAEDPAVFLSDMVNRFAEPDGIRNRAHRLQGVATLRDVPQRDAYLALIHDTVDAGSAALGEVQRDGRLNDRLAPDTFAELLAGLTVSRAVLDTLGSALPDAAWGWQLDSTFGNLLHINT